MRILCSIIILMSLISAEYANQGTQCGRPPSETIWYPKQPDRVTLASGERLNKSGAAEILSLKMEGGESVVRILASTPVRESTLGSSHVWTSKDGGVSWARSAEDTIWNLNVLGAPLINAPSDKRVIYRIVGNLLLYLRSQDGGKSWRLPRYEVDGLSKEDFAMGIAKTSGYRAWFELAAIHPKQPLTLYATIRVSPWAEPLNSVPLPVYFQKGMFVSKDGGETWNKFSDSLSVLSVLGISPSNSTIMYGTGQGGLVRTENGGKSWEPVGQQKELNAIVRYTAEKTENIKPGREVRLEVRQIAFDPEKPEIVYVVANKGIFRTLNAGRSWFLLDLGFDALNSVNSLEVNTVNPKEIFVGTSFGVLKSSDQGCSFEAVFPPKTQNSARESPAIR